MTSLDQDAVAVLVARSRRDVDDGTLPSCQIALGFDGALVWSETFGAAAASRYVTFSVSKAFHAALGWLLIGDGALSPKTTVAEVVPEFSSNGKEMVTIEQLLTHTAGFARAPMRPLEGADPAARVARMATWRLDWEPGSRTEYHATSAYWALVTVAERLSGTDFRTMFSDRIAGPLGLPGLTLGAAIGTQGDVRPLELVGRRVEGQGLGDQVAEVGEAALLRFNEPDVMAVGVPGAGGVAGAADIAMYYQALLHPSADVWDPAVMLDATSNIRNRMDDPLIQCPANRTLGLVVCGDDGRGIMRGFGKTSGPRAFGAMGVGGQIAWADPATGLSFSYLTNGLDIDVQASWTRSAKIAGLAARCVAL